MSINSIFDKLIGWIGKIISWFLLFISSIAMLILFMTMITMIYGGYVQLMGATV